AGTGATVAEALRQLATGEDMFLFPSLALAASEPASTLSSAAGRAGLSWPLHGPEASGFGPRIHPVLGRPMFHTGIDLMAACGTPIHAAADGQVVYAAVTPSWGRRVIIRHSTSLETGYAHMSRFLVAQGDLVKRGQVIGLVGTTGWSTGCHLHFDVIVDGNYVDPAPYLGLPGTSPDQVPYTAAPHVESGTPGSSPRTVEDGDVPVTAAVRPSPRLSAPDAPAPRPPSPSPSTTGSPTSTSSPSTSATSGPTTSNPAPTGSATTGSPTTTNAPATGTPATGTPAPTTTVAASSTTTTTTTGTTTQVPTGSATSGSSPTTSASSSEPCDCASTNGTPTGTTGSTGTTASTNTSPSTTGTSATSPGTATSPDCPDTCPTTTSATSSATETVAATTQALLASTAGASRN
ncbi:peptidase M23, partial [Intrasporangium chromatireducens Q5-1]